MIGDRIRQRREELNITQQELADRLNLKSKSSITKIEKGERGFSAGKLSEVAKALNCTTSYLLEIDDKPSWDLGFELDEEMCTVFQAYFYADDTTREMVKRILAPNYGKYPER